MVWFMQKDAVQSMVKKKQSLPFFRLIECSENSLISCGSYEVISKAIFGIYIVQFAQSTLREAL